MIVFIITILGVCAAVFRHALIVNLYKNPNPSLLQKVDEGPNVEWFDDYYTIQKLDDNVFAIGEPRYWQRNINYLVIGDESALLIDAGPGVRDINPVVQSLTKLPYTLITTHFHFDHAGNGFTFPKVAMVDLPHLRKRSPNDIIQLTKLETLGKPEGYSSPAIKVDQWIKPGEIFELGNRKVQVIYTPGHTVESISLYDQSRKILFTGDWFTPLLGPMFSNSNMGDFSMAISNVLCSVAIDTRIFGAHRYDDRGGAPEQTIAELKEVAKGIRLIESGHIKGKGIYPVQYQVTPEIELYADVVWFQNWAPTYPELGEASCGS